MGNNTTTTVLPYIGREPDTLVGDLSIRLSNLDDFAIVSMDEERSNYGIRQSYQR